MDNISEIKVTDCIHSAYVKPLRLCYKQNGISKIWDVIQVHHSVSIIIFNVSRKRIVLVKQYRPAVHFNSIPEAFKTDSIDVNKYPGRLGITLELCAGIVDKNESLEEIARQEVLEECGYDVPTSALEKVVKLRGGVGFSGDQQTMFYVEVTDEMKVSKGGGNPSEGEFIEVVEMTIPEMQKYTQNEEVASPAGFLFGMTWFLTNKAPFYDGL